jgi:hypothetical protein
MRKVKYTKGLNANGKRMIDMINNYRTGVLRKLGIAEK